MTHGPVDFLARGTLATPLGEMTALARDDALLRLEFSDLRGRREEQAGGLPARSSIQEGRNGILEQIARELSEYFAGDRQVFDTPFVLDGTPFQRLVWRQLTEIRFGETWSYRQLAESLGRPTGFRAVAGANARNPLAIIVPCHRVINSSGALGGYAGGLSRKQRLLELESRAR